MVTKELLPEDYVRADRDNLRGMIKELERYKRRATKCANEYKNRAHIRIQQAQIDSRYKALVKDKFPKIHKAVLEIMSTEGLIRTRKKSACS
jgi:hypothetical protein